MIPIGITDHVEGPAGRPSGEVYNEVADLVRLADGLGVRYAWFAEHHAHAHEGHLPAPLLLALHLAGQTSRIQLGCAVICLNLHHPLHIAEQVAVADTLSGGRMAVGFGSGSTSEECEWFGVPDHAQVVRHARFAEALQVIRSAWGREGSSSDIAVARALPVPRADLMSRCWIAVNSLGAARIAGQFNLNVLFSHLRTPEQQCQFLEAYRAAGGDRLVAANRPVFVAADDATAWSATDPALRLLWRRFRAEGKIPREMVEPDSPAQLCPHPLNFIVGGPPTVARQIRQLREQAPFDILNVELRWAGLPHEAVRGSLGRLMEQVVPLI